MKDYYLVKTTNFTSKPFNGLLNAYAFIRNNKMVNFQIILCDCKTKKQHVVLRSVGG